MDRNIITESDVRGIADSEDRPGDVLATPAVPGGIAPNADTYFDKLVKYVPIEVIGAYLIIEGLLKSLLEGESLSWGLLILFLLGLLTAWFFAGKVLGVMRRIQLAVTSLAFAVWVFAVGGWFATLPFWAPGWGTIAVVVFAILVQILRVGPLPPEQATETPVAGV